MQRILILPNPHKPKAIKAAREVIPLLEERGLAVACEAGLARDLGRPDNGRAEAELGDGIDLVLVLGGDGSILNAARRVYPRQIPLLGVNLGHFGFLTCLESHQLHTVLDDLVSANFQVEARAMLEARIDRAGSELPGLVALNDLVVAKSSLARMVRLETWIDQEYFTTYPADGLIVATATGSTAYSLSAGGPIMDPRIGALLVTPICAHSLYARPLVLSKDARIKVVLDASHNDMALTADGQSGLALRAGDAIHFQRAKFHTNLVRLKEQGRFEVLKARLKEGRI